MVKAVHIGMSCCRIYDTCAVRIIALKHVGGIATVHPSVRFLTIEIFYTF